MSWKLAGAAAIAIVLAVYAYRIGDVPAYVGLDEAHYANAPVALATDVLRAELEARGLSVVELPSGAGHDAGILAAAGVESSMLFVRSLNGGASHSPEERSSDEDVALAVEVLTGTLRRLAESK